jgi:predicted kinase
MNILYITVGAPRSGKTTWANKKVKEVGEHSILNINRDDVRREMYGFSAWSEYKFTKEKETAVTEVCDELFAYAKKQGKDIICSDTNINPKTRDKLVCWAKQNNYQVEYVHFDVPLHILEKRNADSEYGVSPEILTNMWLSYQEQFGEKYVPDPNKPIAVIFDIDGTLADHNGVRSPFQWDRVHLDSPRPNVVHLLNMYKHLAHYKIIIMSGRDGVCRKLTEQWLKEQYIDWDEFMMRPEGSQEPDYKVKRDLFDKVKDNYNIVLAVDDRDQIVNLWRSMGIETWQVNYGKF